MTFYLFGLSKNDFSSKKNARHTFNSSKFSTDRFPNHPGDVTLFSLKSTHHHPVYKKVLQYIPKNNPSILFLV